MEMYQFFKWKDIVQAMGLQLLAPMLALKRVAISQNQKQSTNILKFLASSSLCLYVSLLKRS